MITHLVDPALFDQDTVTVEGDAYRHLFRARRLALGERLRAVDGGGRARWGEVTAVGRRSATLALEAPAPTNEPAYRLDLLVAPIRAERASWLVEKATELGVASVRFVGFERAPRRYGDGTFERLGRVARSAVEQCHRAMVPAVTGVHEPVELERLLIGHGDRFVLDPEADDSARPRANALTGAVIIGPEGGFAPAEQKMLARLALPVGLGPRILRVETAALVAAAWMLG